MESEVKVVTEVVVVVVSDEQKQEMEPAKQDEKE
jgi:hypothetical protein